jgi:hypothetical protein
VSGTLFAAFGALLQASLPKVAASSAAKLAARFIAVAMASKN